jgi:calcineurin-like phosphoesterase family protein
MIYFTADTHFYHSNIINSCERPFKDVFEMNKVMIQNWNSYVTDRDDIYILGDFIYKGKGKEANEILSKLKGRKYLITGNHDWKFLNDPVFETKYFEWVKDYYLLKLEGGMKVILFHYPLLSWDGSHHGSIHLYGHVHNSGIKYSDFGKKIEMLGHRAINVGVDVNDFYPVSIKQILDQVKNIKEEKDILMEEN